MRIRAILQLKAMRPSMRAYSIKHKLISDPEHRTDLTGAITVVGTCRDMCPEYERHEREFQKDVDDWEKVCTSGHIQQRLVACGRYVVATD